ncbi:hypothetical protein ACKKBG_A08190 [Auxenochlorella protothecoides x Auxenochlorella symbiontica]
MAGHVPSQTQSLPFVGGRRRLQPDDSLFEFGNRERERIAAEQRARSLADAITVSAPRPAPKMMVHVTERSQEFACRHCRASLPSPHLLDLHLTEMHDSFFAAQAARRLPVYRCLVESCEHTTCSTEERREHLLEAHGYDPAFHFETSHLRGRRARAKPVTVIQACKGPPTRGDLSQPDVVRMDTEGGPVGVEESLSRLSLANVDLAVPNRVEFGRRQSVGLFPRSQGRQRG